MGSVIEEFVTRVIEVTDFTDLDRVYLTNRLLALIGEGDKQGMVDEDSDLLGLMDGLIEQAVQNGRVEPDESARDILGAQLMDLLTPAPSQVNQRFWNLYQSNPQEAISDFYALSRRNNYIKTREIAKNIAFEQETAVGALEITINLSKPEKDPKAIAAARALPQSDYPLCQLCFENEGYLGRANHPARSNHRVIRFDLLGETWGFQYSPYAYFNEHCIFFDQIHRPMKISRMTFERLLAIVDAFPGYFAGSNADLPIVGGSILTHEHYQGGRHTFPMDKASVREQINLPTYPRVTLSILDWPMTVLKLESQEQEELLQLAEKILDEWRAYSDPTIGVHAFTNGTPHHTVTPIARKSGSRSILYLVLRDNQTTEAYPDGLFHPHPDVHHIKKENIGLIEVMGLAILPPRLKEELVQVEAYVAGKPAQVAKKHLAWAEELKAAHPQVDEDAARAVVRAGLGAKFARVLEDAGVFKRTPEGHAALTRFIDCLR